jgi:hypothetical protein
MDKISVHDILLQCGEWTESSKFISLVAKARKVEDRRAYQLAKNAYESRDEHERIYKHIFRDRDRLIVWYGLPEFGPPSVIERRVYVVQKQKEDPRMAAVMAYYRNRAERDNIPFLRKLVKEYDDSKGEYVPEE